MKKLKAVTFWLVVALYLNIGYGIGDFYNNLQEKTPQTATEKIMAGGWGFLGGPPPTGAKRTPLTDGSGILTGTIFWPLIVALVATSWFVFGMWKVACLVWLATIFLFKLVFMGGLVKMVGLGHVISYLVTVLSALCIYKTLAGWRRGN